MIVLATRSMELFMPIPGILIWYVIRGKLLVENDYERVFPLTPEKNQALIIYFSLSLPSNLECFQESKLNEDIVEEFIDNIPAKYKFVEINLNTFNKLDDINSNSTQILPMNLIYDILTKQFTITILITKKEYRQALKC